MGFNTGLIALIKQNNSTLRSVFSEDEDDDQLPVSLAIANCVQLEQFAFTFRKFGVSAQVEQKLAELVGQRTKLRSLSIQCEIARHRFKICEIVFGQGETQ